MRSLYHLPLDPGSRKVRILLKEKGLDCALKSEKTWERREDFLRLNPAGEVPVLIEPEGTVVTGAMVIAEYLEEVYPEPAMIGSDPLDRAEVRRLCAWFDGKFGQEVSSLLIEEKVMKRFLGLGHPEASAIRAALHNIHYHLEYVVWLSDRRNWLAGESFSLADAAAAAQISTIDYLGDIPWDEHPEAKEWYARVKSRPSMREILADYVPGFPPPKHYPDPDF